MTEVHPLHLDLRILSVVSSSSLGVGLTMIKADWVIDTSPFLPYVYILEAWILKLIV